jgi:trigger factor
LKINLEPRDDHQVKIIAEFETSSLDQYKGKAARRIASKAKIPGFRPGKAPYDVIARFYGEPAIEEDAIELMMEEVYPDILTEAKISPAAPGMLEDVDKGDPIKFTFVIPLEPTVDLGSYREIRKAYTPEPVTEEQVDEFIQRLRRTYATAEPIERPAEVGDLVYVKVNATIINPSENDKPELLKDSPLQLVIGENDPEDNGYPYTGFGDELIGLSANQEKTFRYTYTQDSKFENLRGKEVEFHVLLQNVKKLTLPEENDEFAKMFGEYESFEQLKEGAKQQLAARQQSDYDLTYFEDLLDEVAQKATVKFPPQVLEHEMEHIVESVTHDLSHQHMDLETYLKTIKKEKEAWMEEDVKPAAVKNLTKSLVIQELSKVEGIKFENEDLQAEVTNMLVEMQQNTEPKALEKQLKNKDFINAVTMEAASRVINRKTFERMKEIATGTFIESKEEDKAVEPKKSTRKSAKTAEPTVDTVAEEKPKARKTTKKVTEPAADN